MHELITNLHIHTTRSDGSGTPEYVARAAIKAGLDVILVTDHNIPSNAIEGYYHFNSKKVLLISAQEIHDPDREPEGNHLLVFGNNEDLSSYAHDPGDLINYIIRQQGSCFLAHPFENTLPMANEKEYSWANWDVENFTGMEIWNGLSELKSVTHNRFQLLLHVLFPSLIAHGPSTLTLQKWDELLKNGKKVIAVGGSDAHALIKKMGPLKITIFPYEFHFRAINTHVLVPTPMSGNLEQDRLMILQAIKTGSSFVGYDLPHSTKGFRFIAQGEKQTASIGEEISLNKGITFQIRLPHTCECHLIKDGQLIKIWREHDACTYIVNQPGVYRVECYINYLAAQRGWIFSNPIYVLPTIKYDEQ